MNKYFIYLSDEYCYPVYIFADSYLRDKNRGYCYFFNSDGDIVVQFPLDQISDICKVGDYNA